MFHQPDLFEAVRSDKGVPPSVLNLPDIIERIADVSPRPRYAFMVLNLIAKAASKANGSAGPYVVENGRRIPLRDWLCDSLVPMAKRDARRRSIVDEVTAALEARGALPFPRPQHPRIVSRSCRLVVRHL